MRLLLEQRGPSGPAPVPLPCAGEALVAFMSFAVSRGFGATHPLAALADRLHAAHGLRLGHLTTFYDADEEDAEDREKRELTWQPADELRAEADAVAAALGEDAQCAALLRRAGSETLPAALAMLSAALGQLPPGSDVRLGYQL